MCGTRGPRILIVHFCWERAVPAMLRREYKGHTTYPKSLDLGLEGKALVDNGPPVSATCTTLICPHPVRVRPEK